MNIKTFLIKSLILIFTAALILLISYGVVKIRRLDSIPISQESQLKPHSCGTVEINRRILQNPNYLRRIINLLSRTTFTKIHRTSQGHFRIFCVSELPQGLTLEEFGDFMEDVYCQFTSREVYGFSLKYDFIDIYIIEGLDANGTALDMPGNRRGIILLNADSFNKATAVHEFFHHIQFSYIQRSYIGWFIEGMAEWAERLYKPIVVDYQNDVINYWWNWYVYSRDSYEWVSFWRYFVEKLSVDSSYEPTDESYGFEIVKGLLEVTLEYSFKSLPLSKRREAEIKYVISEYIQGNNNWDNFEKVYVDSVFAGALKDIDDPCIGPLYDFFRDDVQPYEDTSFIYIDEYNNTTIGDEDHPFVPMGHTYLRLNSIPENIALVNIEIESQSTAMYFIPIHRYSPDAPEGYVLAPIETILEPIGEGSFSCTINLEQYPLVNALIFILINKGAENDSCHYDIKTM